MEACQCSRRRNPDPIAGNASDTKGRTYRLWIAVHYSTDTIAVLPDALESPSSLENRQPYDVLV